MITPKSFFSLIRHFDELDDRVTLKLLARKPFDETALTQYLCYLMDSDTQKYEKIKYHIEKLNKKLHKYERLGNVSMKLETKQFSSHYENWVSESDIGLCINYENQFEPRKSWTKYYLLQAKRLYPTSNGSSDYDTNCKFSAIDKTQEAKIKFLKSKVGDSIKYMLYCPRSKYLNKIVRNQLSYIRNSSISNEIFDYTMGAAIYKDLTSKNKTLAAGIFITNIENNKLTLGKIHSRILKETIPFSWFISTNFLESKTYHNLFNTINPENKLSELKYRNEQEYAKKIINYDESVIEEIANSMSENNKNSGIAPKKFTIFPASVLVLKYSLKGNHLNDNNALF